MKKSLSFLMIVAAMMSMSMPAQAVQKVMGHYASDSIAASGVAMSGNGLVPLAVMLEPDEMEIYQGGKIVAFRVGLSEPAEVTRVFVIPVSATGKYGDKTEWNCEVNQAGWNVIQLETPYELNLASDEKLLMGFYYRQTDGSTPISLVKQGDPYDTYLYKKVGFSNKWVAAGVTDQGNLSVQCIVERDSYPDYMITAADLRTSTYVTVGDELPLAFNVRNKGLKTVEAGAFTASILIDGKQVGSIDNDESFGTDYYTISGMVPTTGIPAGEHTLTVTPSAVDGEAIENTVELSTSFIVYRGGFPRQKHLVEQLTSTYCTYCPLGNSMLSMLTAQRDDIIWVGIHGNLGSGVDPYCSDQGDSIMVYLTGGSISYPSAAFDRTTGWADDVNIVNSIGYYEQYHQEVAGVLGNFFDYIADTHPTMAQINGNCYVNPDTRMATVSILGHVAPDFDLMLGDDALLTVYLVEDSLVARQLDNGIWKNSYTHNGVFRQALGSVRGVKLNMINDNTYKNTFRFQLPASWQWRNLRVVAFISRPLTNSSSGYTDMWVNNAEQFKFQLSAGVDEIVPDADAVPVEYYDVMGRRADGIQPGLNIIRMSDGTARKVFVK